MTGQCIPPCSELWQKKKFPPRLHWILIVVQTPWRHYKLYCDRRDEHSHNEERAINLERETSPRLIDKQCNAPTAAIQIQEKVQFISRIP